MEDHVTHPHATPRCGAAPPPRRPGERGQLAVGLVLTVAALGLALGIVVTVARGHLALARARAAADAAALAAALDGPGGAHRVAAANGAVVLAVVERGPCVEVRVRAGPAEARARARRVTGPPPGPMPGPTGPHEAVEPSAGDPAEGECPLPAAPVP